MVWKTLHFDIASGTTWIPPGPTAWECKGVTLTMTLIIYNFLNFLPHLLTAHFSPFPRGSPSHLREFSECIWTCSGAWLLGLLSSAQSKCLRALWWPSATGPISSGRGLLSCPEPCDCCGLKPRTLYRLTGAQLLQELTGAILYLQCKFLSNFPVPSSVS